MESMYPLNIQAWLNNSPYNLPGHPHLLPDKSSEYRVWLSSLRPRTCLLVQWLADIGVVAEPGPATRAKAARFSAKHALLGNMAEISNEESVCKINNLFEIGVLNHEDLHIYATWVVWLRFQEYIPRRFVLPGGRDNVFQWVRGRLRRPELTAAETLNELCWQAHRISSEWEDAAHWEFE